MVVLKEYLWVGLLDASAVEPMVPRMVVLSEQTMVCVLVASMGFLLVDRLVVA